MRVDIKKIFTRKLVILYFLVMMLFIGVIITLSLSFDSFSLTTIKKPYCYVCTYNEKQEVEVMIYVSNKRAYVTNISKLNHVYIQNADCSEKLLIDVKSINDKNKKERINDKDYFLYSFVFEIPLVTTEEYDLSIEDAIISLEYDNENIEINIGSFYLYKIPYYGDNYANLSISKLKAIVNVMNGNKTISGINLSFTNNTDNQILLTKIKMFHGDVYPSVNDIITINNQIQSSDSISSILGYKYNLKSSSDNYPFNCNLDFEIGANELVEYLIPLKYYQEYAIDKLGFMIEYQMNNHTYKLYYDDFMFFTDMNIIVNTNELDIAVYENK